MCFAYLTAIFPLKGEKVRYGITNAAETAVVSCEVFSHNDTQNPPYYPCSEGSQQGSKLAVALIEAPSSVPKNQYNIAHTAMTINANIHKLL